MKLSGLAARINGRLIRLAELWKRIGTIELAKFIYRRLITRNAWPAQPWIKPGEKADFIRHYQFARYAPFGAPINAATAVKTNTINWVIPDVGIGSGGHLNIFRLIFFLEQHGFECRVVINGGSHFSSVAEIRDCIVKNYVPIKADVFVGGAAMPPAWFTFATSWITAYTVRNFQSTVHKCYFVQDFEPFFFAHGTDFALAEQTYRFGFLGITAGRWLAEKLSREYGMKTVPIGFSFDKDRYHPKTSRQRTAERNVFFYARPMTQRRGFELGLMVLDEAAKRIPDLNVIFAGEDIAPFAVPFRHVNAGIVSLDDLPDLYNRCDAALVISLTNLSLLPLELIACGCPVVSNNGPNVEWLLNREIAALAEPTVEALSDTLISVLTDEDYRRRLIEAGLTFAKTTDWAREADTVARVMTRLQENETGPRGGNPSDEGAFAALTAGRPK